MALQLGMPNLSLQRQFGGGDGSLEGNDGLTTGTWPIANAIASQMLAQKVVASAPHNIESITIAASKVGSPTGDVSIAIYSHSEGSDHPGALLGTASGTIDKSTCPGTEDTWEFTGLDVDILSDTYWIVVICTDYDAANHMLWAYTAAQTDGTSTVRSFNGSLWSILSTVTTMKYNVFGTALDIAAPATPANLVALLSDTTPQIDLTWDAAVGAEEYTVEYKPTLGSTWVAATTTLETTSYTMLALDPGKSYDFRIVATAFSGTSGASNIETAVADGYIRHAFIENDPFDEHLFADYLTGLWSVTSWAADYDFTGVSWETDDVASGAVHKDEQRATLIGRDCFVCAYHWAPAVGTMLTFTDAAGTKFDYEVATRSDEITVGGYTYDGCVGTLTEVVSDTLTSYAIEEDAYIDQYLVSTRSRFSETVEHPSSQQAMIERVSGWSYGSEPSPDAQWFVAGAPGTGIPADVAVNRFTADNGDSGDPLFTYRDGKLKVYSTYHGTQNGPYLGFPTMLSQIDAFLALQGTEREAFSLPPKWWTEPAVENLFQGFDMRGIEGGSVLTENVNGGISGITDLSGNGNGYSYPFGDTHAQIAPLNAAGDGLAIGGAERFNFRATRGGTAQDAWHFFAVVRITTPLPYDSTANNGWMWGLSGGLNYNSRPYIYGTSCGGGASGRFYGQFSGGDVIGSDAVWDGAFEGLAGRLETDAKDRYGLLEFVGKPGEYGRIYVNGFLSGEDSAVAATLDTATYMTVATKDGTYGLDLFAAARGEYDQGFTEADAAKIRAAMMEDYGIEEFDGVTVPQKEFWFDDPATADLLMAYDFRGVDGSSDIFLDGNSKLWIASDLSGRGNDYEAISAGSSVNPSVNAAVDGGGVRLSQPENNKLYSTSRAARGMAQTDDDHTFVVLKMRSAKAIDDTTKALGLINISSRGGNNPKVLFSNAGGAAVFGSNDAYEYWTQNGNVLKGGNVNLSSLTGRAETDAADRYALVEVRRDEVASRAQVWVNGFLVAEDTSVSSNAYADYDYIGMATLDYEADIYAWATGDILTTGFTLEQAAAVRAALMADYGIEVWDGATYPQP